jgi:hypothetical protein
VRKFRVSCHLSALPSFSVNIAFTYGYGPAENPLPSESGMDKVPFLCYVMFSVCCSCITF